MHKKTDLVVHTVYRAGRVEAGVLDRVNRNRLDVHISERDSKKFL
jgi:hypothetical protein